MSRMTKFLKQSCTFEAAVRDARGEISLNKYGEARYEAPIILKCRRERTTKDVLTANGSVVRSASIYYTDESQVIRPDDKIDGRVVLSVEEYTNELGLTEGFESNA